MTWFKVDDNYWSHPKVMLTSLRASGLWVRAGAWCANHLTDGRIPDRMLHMIIPETPATIAKAAKELVEVGLWTREGDEWVFHDWHDMQPARSDVIAAREADAERKRKGRQTQRKLRSVRPDS